MAKDKDEDIQAVETRLKSLYQLLKNGAPEFKWNEARMKVGVAWQVIDALHKGQTPPEAWAMAVENARDALDSAMKILSNKDGTQSLDETIIKLQSHKATLLKKQAETVKASGETINRSDYLEEIDAIQNIILREIDGRITNRALAAELKNGISAGLAQRRTGKARGSVGYTQVVAAELERVRGSDGEVQAAPLAEDDLQGTGEVREGDGGEAGPPRPAGVGEVVPGEPELSGVAPGV